jgi:hypothetical protein
MTGEPTLHYGDQSADGWVEYAQELLLGVAPNIKVDGIFLDETIKAVYEFQQQNGLMVDGVVGNQTWSVLRGGEQAEVGTDGHAHQDTDATMHAVFFADQSPLGKNGETSDDGDSLLFFLESVGSIPIPDNQYFLDINITGGSQGVTFKQLPLTSVSLSGQANAGEMMSATVANLREELGTGDFTYDAEMPPGLGAEKHSGQFSVQ